MAIGCTVCGSPKAKILHEEFGVGEIVDCDRCGSYQTSHEAADQFGLPFKDANRATLASHVIRKMQAARARPKLTRQFFESLQSRSLPTPAEASDNLILLLAARSDGRPGAATSGRSVLQLQEKLNPAWQVVAPPLPRGS